jgi:hypothetical protein
MSQNAGSGAGVQNPAPPPSSVSNPISTPLEFQKNTAPAACTTGIGASNACCSALVLQGKNGIVCVGGQAVQFSTTNKLGANSKPYIGVSCCGYLYENAVCGKGTVFRVNGVNKLILRSGSVASNQPIQIKSCSTTPCTAYQFNSATQGACSHAMFIGNKQITVCASLREYKENFAPFDSSALDLIEKIPIHSYCYKPEDEAHDKGRAFGFVKEEVQEVLPFVTCQVKMIGVLTRAVQELNRKIERLTPSSCAEDHP